MIKLEKKIAGILRVVLASLILLAQLLLLFLLVINLKQMFVYAYFILEAIGLVEVLVLIDKNRGSSYTIAWIVTILVLPVFGVLLYFLWGKVRDPQPMRPEDPPDFIPTGGMAKAGSRSSA